MEMFKCEYCDKELKSNAGKAAHERSCKARDIEDVSTEEANLDDAKEALEYLKKESEKQSNIKSYSNGIEDVLAKEVIEPTDKVVQLEVLGTGGHYPNGKDNNYYEGHPRREIKLRGLLSRTFEPKERSKIMKMIIELRKG